MGALTPRKCVAGIILSELRMPVMAGCEAISPVKQSEGTKNIHVQ
jgi:CheY-like chemotaxis protein